MDGLSELFSHDPAVPVNTATTNTTTTPSSQAPAATGRYPLPQRHAGTLPVRSAPVGQPGRAPGASDCKKLRWSNKGGIDAIENDIVSVIEGLKSGAGDDMAAENDVLLVVDQPDLLLAATGQGMGVGGTEILEMIMGLRQVCALIIQVVWLPNWLLTERLLVACSLYGRHLRFRRTSGA